MEYVILVFLLILISTIKPKYLGGLKFLSLEKFLSSYNTKIIRYSLLLAFILYITIMLFKKELTGYWYSLTEGFTSSPQEYQYENVVELGNYDMSPWNVGNSWRATDAQWIWSSSESLQNATVQDSTGMNWNEDGTIQTTFIYSYYFQPSNGSQSQDSNGNEEIFVDVDIQLVVSDMAKVKINGTTITDDNGNDMIYTNDGSSNINTINTTFQGYYSNQLEFIVQSSTDSQYAAGLLVSVRERATTEVLFVSEGDGDGNWKYVNPDYSPAPQEFPGSISPDANTMVAADRYIARAEVYTRNNEYQEALDNYQKALNIKLELATNTQQDQIAAIYDAISNIYGDMAAAAGCDYQDDPNSEECNTANNYLQQQQENYNLSLEYYEKDIYYESGGAPDSWTPGAYAPETSEIYESSMATGLEPDDVTPEPIYYQPGTVSYGGAGYQPTDVDIAYFRNYKSTPASLFVVDETENPNGFCDLKDTLVNMDQKCSEQPLDVCASTNCCVLMGGQKCVYGNEFGPINKTIYSDTSIKNRDVYYYRGKCYGDCI